MYSKVMKRDIAHTDAIKRNKTQKKNEEKKLKLIQTIL